MSFAVLRQLADSGRQFDLILADPPYGEKNVGRRSTSFAQQLLDEAILPKLLAPGGRFVLGHTKRDTLEIVAPWKEVKLLKHGDSVMRFFELVAADVRRRTCARHWLVIRLLTSATTRLPSPLRGWFA